MNAQECDERLEAITRLLEQPVEIERLDDLEPGAYSAAGRVALPCFPAGRFDIRYQDGEDFISDIPITVDGEELGFLCLTSKLRSAGTPLNAATDVQKTAFIKFVSTEEFDASLALMRRMDMDCAVIWKQHLDRFLRYRSTSPVWGGFVLEADAIPREKYVSSADSSSIVVSELGNPRTHRHQSALQRSTSSQYVTDRFLNLYHFLELDYDHEIVDRIKNIDPNNTKGLEKLLSTGRTELERLHLIFEGFSQFDRLEQIFGTLRQHRDVALTVFYDYGKEQNPLKDRAAFELQFLDAPAINRQVLDEIKKRNNLESNFAKENKPYSDMLLKLACYWIYRIRCCIAHNKLGEYHLHTAEDMKFCGEFGEPLLMAFISHRLRG